jgi:hypothetical protein
MVVAPGTLGTYTEGLTVTSVGGTPSATLSGNSGVLTVGQWILINGRTNKVTAINGNSITLTYNVEAGIGMAIAYAAPTLANIGCLVSGNIVTAVPGNATQNTRRGRVAIAAGASSVTVFNSRVMPTSMLFATLQSADSTLTQIINVIPSSGLFVINGNASATNACNICWRLED